MASIVRSGRRSSHKRLETLGEIGLREDASASTQGPGLLNHLNQEGGMVAESFAFLRGVYHDAVKPLFRV